MYIEGGRWLSYSLNQPIQVKFSLLHLTLPRGSPPTIPLQNPKTIQIHIQLQE